MIIKNTNIPIKDKYCAIPGNIFDDYSCVLNMTDISLNKNKFYIIQIIKSDEQKYHIYIRYGRIGEKGGIITEIYKKKNDAILRFCTQFKKKTGNNFGGKFIKKQKKYFLSEIDEPQLKETIVKNKNLINDQHDDLIDDNVKKLLDIMTNKKMLRESLIKLNIDLEKLPLGKISKNQIQIAKEILSEINKILIRPDYSDENLNNDPFILSSENINKDDKFIIFKDNKKELSILSSKYYNMIPYS